MEHGLDARLPAIHESGPDLPAFSSRQHHVLAAVRVPREFRSCAEPRRGGLRQALVAIQDAGRRMAEARQPPDVSRVDVWASWQKAPLYGRRIRPMERMEPRHQP